MTAREQREADAMNLLALLAGGTLAEQGALPADDPLRARITNAEGAVVVQRTALRRELEEKLFDWIEAGYPQREPDDPPLSDRLYHGSASDRAKDEPTAIDILVEGLPVADRVRIRRIAQAAGYKRPWGRGS